MRTFNNISTYSPHEPKEGENLPPEKFLWMNVIFRAYWDMSYYLENNHLIKDKVVKNQNRLNARDARNWILSSKNTPQSFLWCVDMCFSNQKAVEIINKFRKLADTLK